ncbi:hypothetical protein [Angustibacter peucedani]
MDPSSLIFVVIVAIWAAYLLGHWVRRRDQVATARSVDRFSDAMRVLERRPAVRTVPLSRPNPRSYVVAPAQRPAPSVVVKRAAAVVRPEPGRPEQVRPEPPRPDLVRRESVRPAARRPAPSARPARGRRVRGLAFLGLLVATPVVWLAAALSTAVTAWFGVVVTTALLLVVAELRRSARRARDLARRRDVTARRTASRSRRDSRRHVVGQVVAARRTAGPEVSTSAPDDEVVAEPAAHDVPDDGSWQPVPVPPPTYTLKPKAPPVRRRVLPEQAAPAPAEPVVEAPVAEPAAMGGFDLDAILERRIAAGG